MTLIGWVLAASMAAAGAGPPPPVPPSPFFPLAKGTMWTYRGTVKWTLMNSSTVREKELTWTMEVLDSRQADGRTLARLRGHPADLCWYEDGKAPGVYWIIREADRYFDVGDLEDPSGPLDLARREAFLDLPLFLDKRWGDAEQVQRPDGMYCWVVSEVRREKPAGIKGLDAGRPVEVYRAAYRTNPDHQLVDYAPGVGIVRYQFVHHGTVSECDMTLVEYRPGK
jgi:hypothetical protein